MIAHIDFFDFFLLLFGFNFVVLEVILISYNKKVIPSRSYQILTIGSYIFILLLTKTVLAEDSKVLMLLVPFLIFLAYYWITPKNKAMLFEIDEEKLKLLLKDYDVQYLRLQSEISLPY